MGKEGELLQVVKDQDVGALHRMLVKNRGSKTKLIGSTKRLNVNVQDHDGMAALHQAALTGSTDMMRLLLDAGATIDIEDHKGMRPLHYAAWQGKEEPVAILLSWRSSANLPAHDGETPLHLAAQHGHYDVMRLLLQHHGDPTLSNKVHKTPLDLACEFGRYRVVELLLSTNPVASLLPPSPEDTADNDRTTFLHLAARNGHTDVIRLLLQTGVDINRSTLKGTCLHEAALYGKIEVVRLLLDCGIDVNRPDSYDQTALDIVNKFTTSRAGKELKQLLKEASYAVHARAVTDHHNLYEPNSLSFKEGDYIKVLEQRTDGTWRGYVMHDGHRRIGHFPSQSVVLVDSQAVVKNLPHLRYSSGHVMSPQVPDLINNKHVLGHVVPVGDVNNQHVFPAGGGGGVSHPGGGGGVGGVAGNHLSSEHIHNPYGSIGIDRTFPPPPSPLLPKSPSRDSDRDSGISPQHPMPPHGFSQSSQYLHHASPGSPDDWHNGEVVTHRPPSNGSPGCSNRNSAASTGSGGYYPLGHNNYVNVAITSQHRLSGQSYESGVSGVTTSSSRHSYHSNSSSSSRGSLDRLEESGYSSTVNVHELFQAGLSDTEVLRAWLADLHFEEYFTLFVQAGYNMPTISRMTPEDLTAIGITKPAHRKRLKAEISKLHIHDGIPDFKPGDIAEWCRLLGLDQYLACLVHQGYDHIDSVTDITWEDLEDIGIKLLGHQKKMMLAIERLKRIQSCSRRLSSLDSKGGGMGGGVGGGGVGVTAGDAALEPPSSYPTPQWLIDQQGSGPQHFHHSQLPPAANATAAQVGGAPGSPAAHGGAMSTPSSGHYQVPLSLRQPPGSPSPYGLAQEVAIYTKPKRSPSGENLSGKPSLELSTFQGSTEHLRGKTQLVYQPDVVAIQVNRNTPVRTGSISGPPEDLPGSDGSTGGPAQPVYESFKGPLTPGSLGVSSPAKGGRHGSTDDSVFTFGGEHGAIVATPPRRSSVERTYSDDLDGLATIRRRPSAKVSPRVAPKPKPVAKIVAKTHTHHKRVSRDLTAVQQTDIIKLPPSESIENYNSTGSLDRKLSLKKQYSSGGGNGSDRIYDMPNMHAPSMRTSDLQKPLYISTSSPGAGSPNSPHSPGQYAVSPASSSSSGSGGSSGGSTGSPTGKRAPPPPPKRTNSIKSDHHPHTTQLLRKQQHHVTSSTSSSGDVQQQYQGSHSNNSSSSQQQQQQQFSSSHNHPQHNPQTHQGYHGHHRPAPPPQHPNHPQAHAQQVHPHPGRDVTPPRPPLPQNYTPHPQQPPMHLIQQQQHNFQDSSNYHHQSLSSERYSGGSRDSNGSAAHGHDVGRRGSAESAVSVSSLASVPDAPQYSPPEHDDEDFPPPPPPLSGSPPGGVPTSAQQQHHHVAQNANTRIAPADKDNPLTDVIEQLQGKITHTNTATRGTHHHPHAHAQQHQNQPTAQNSSTSGSGPEWTDSDGSDSDSGQDTIKRRGGGLGGSGGKNLGVGGNCPTGSTDTLPFANENVGTIKSRSQNAKPSILTVTNGDGDGEEGGVEGAGERTVQLDASFFQESGTIKRKPKPEQQQQQQPQQQQQQARGAPSGATAAAAKVKDGKAGDVLNDIGNMLQDLTDELDAMLEFELE